MKLGKNSVQRLPRVSSFIPARQVARVVQLGKLLMVGAVLQSCVSTGGLTEKNSRDAAQYNAQLGAGFLQKGDYEQSRDKLEKALAQDDNNALAHLVYAQLKHAVEEPGAADMHFQRAIKLDPSNASHRNSYGVFLCQTENYDEAQKQFSIAGNNKFYKNPEFAWDNAGVCMLEANKLDEAEDYLRKALRINPTFGKPYLHMAELLYKRERLTVAEAYFDVFASKENDTAESLLLGVYLSRDKGKTADAEAYASRLLNDFPTSVEAGEFIAGPLATQ